jgi:MerR family transcriptional regulator, heat shock protein HspR
MVTARAGRERAMVKEKRRLYMISIVADMFEIHPQTLRAYEREGLIRPSRTEGNTRLYSEEDLERIDLILRLTKDLGVNLAGVEVILNMRDRMSDLRGRMDELLHQVVRRVEQEFQHLEDAQPQDESLVPVRRRGLVRQAPAGGPERP